MVRPVHLDLYTLLFALILVSQFYSYHLKLDPREGGGEGMVFILFLFYFVHPKLIIYIFKICFYPFYTLPTKILKINNNKRFLAVSKASTYGKFSQAFISA